MDISKARLDSLVSRLSEGLNVEIKTWIDPKADESVAKITKAVIALYNRNGGYLIIGFDNKTLLPDMQGASDDVKASFHVDVIQGIVSKYSSISIEIKVGFVELQGLLYPVIAVPQGVTVPAAATKDLHGPDRKKPLIRENTIYFRTLGSNGTPSTSAIKAADWRDLLEICFDNREADIGRFLRRQLGNEGANNFSLALRSSTLEDRARSVLQEGARSRELSIETRKLDASAQVLLQRGIWEVGLVFDPPKDIEDSTKDFLAKVESANPQYTTWPAWLVTSGFRNPDDRPYKRETAWESLVVSSSGEHLDFYRMHAQGQFYQSRILRDDLTSKVKPCTALDPRLAVYFVAEVIAVGLRFAEALDFGADAKLGLMFRWNGLRGRHIDHWVDNGFYSPHHETREDSIESYVEVPADTPASSIAPYAQRAISRLFGSFAGFELKSDEIEIEVNRLLKRN
ncbi:ATP-binding protein [Pseudomonas tremae]|uniref:AlbA family DNA-binding domain-containing protein n=1 Tax=Pseudomonas syringae group TaxID=136849 RepID=UPI0001AF5D32|nr:MULTISPECIES: RNA-binding domain-containing protein [Pseudomonas syringae group]MCQ3018878.1 ATP-binding protein [Pseudomonas tremae]QGL57433.1 ATP-binding protein [Pseudomonas coronafaciens pv. oryzae str. 1_6]RMM31916.1 putative transcriptional regulator [Pseudomonas coronafaciens pv. oryzae]